MIFSDLESGKYVMFLDFILILFELVIFVYISPHP